VAAAIRANVAAVVDRIRTLMIEMVIIRRRVVVVRRDCIAAVVVVAAVARLIRRIHQARIDLDRRMVTVEIRILILI